MSPLVLKWPKAINCVFSLHFPVIQPTNQAATSQPYTTEAQKQPMNTELCGTPALLHFPSF